MPPRDDGHEGENYPISMVCRALRRAFLRWETAGARCSSMGYRDHRLAKRALELVRPSLRIVLLAVGSSADCQKSSFINRLPKQAQAFWWKFTSTQSLSINYLIIQPVHRRACFMRTLYGGGYDRLALDPDGSAGFLLPQIGCEPCGCQVIFALRNGAVLPRILGQAHGLIPACQTLASTRVRGHAPA
jgi:hypothetical protein